MLLKVKEQLIRLIPLMGITILVLTSITKMIGISDGLTEFIARTTLLLISIIIFGYFYQLKFPQLHEIKYQIMFWTFVFIGFLPSIYLIDVNVYLLPLLLGTALITSMIHVRLGIMTNFVMLTLLLVISSLDIEIYLTYIIAGAFVSETIPYAKSRQQMVYVAISNMLIMMLLTVVTTLMIFGDLDFFNYGNMLIAGLNGGLVAIIAIGSEPVWEAIFKITSEARLVELSNSNEPLLKRLLLEAPGTYHHSMVVANLAEKAAIDTHCNYQLARVGAMYHDIGKILKPDYYMENQQGVNIHDDLSPDASAVYIISHVIDGLKLAKEHRLPIFIQDIILQHHGDSLLAFFYNKALKHSDGFEIDESVYQYPGPKPQTKEAAIVMLADCVEAATKGLKQDERHMENIKKLVGEVFLTVFKNNQLNDCPIKMNELPIIAKSFLKVYNGMFHERIKYDREIKTERETLKA